MNYKRFLFRNTPAEKRSIFSLGLQYGLGESLKYVANLFVGFRQKSEYELLFNGQVIYLEVILNDMFDATNRDIFITDGDYMPYVFFFKKAEDEAVYFDSGSIISGAPVYFPSLNDIANQIDFIINIPTSLNIDENALNALIKRFKIAGKKYGIIYF